MLSFPNFFKRRVHEITLGRTGKHRFFPRFKVSYNVRKFHTYVVGLTGRGKSKFLQNCLVQDIVAGRGCAAIDPHGDLAKDTLRTLIARGFFNNPDNLKKIIYISPRRRDYLVPFNVLARPEEGIETYEVAQRVIAAFQRTWASALAEAPRFQQIMRSSLAVLIETNQPITHLYSLLTNDTYRRELIDKIPNPKVAVDCRAFFEQEFEQWGRDRTLMIGSTTNKISALTDNPSIFYMLNQKENHINIREIMDSGKTLLVDLGDCDQETKRLFGTLIVTGFEQAALSRANAPIESRKSFYLYIDEFQDFACQPGNAETFSQMLSQVRKFGLHMILANQSIAQLDKRLQTALNNAQTIISFRVSRADAEALSKILGQVNIYVVKRENQADIQHPIYTALPEQWEQIIQQLTRLKVRQVLVKTADDRQAIIWPEKINSDECTEIQLEKIILQSLKLNGKPLSEIDKGINITELPHPSNEFYT